jgi:hypothetical protein
LPDDLLEYVAFEIKRLMTLHKYYLRLLPKCRFIKAESKRYVELYAAAKPQRNDPFRNNGRLPAEIIERSQVVKKKYDTQGTKECEGCHRSLHQDSFRTMFKLWEKPRVEKLCSICSTVKRQTTPKKW